MSLISITITVHSHIPDALPLLERREDTTLTTQKFALSEGRQADLVGHLVRVIETYRQSVSMKDL